MPLNAPRWTHVTTEISAADVVRHARGLGPITAIWARPDQGASVCAVGVAASVEIPGAATLEALLERPEGAAALPCGPWMGGMAFDARSTWEGVPALRFVLPEWLVWRRGGRTWLTAISVVTSTIEDAHRELHARLDEASRAESPYTPESTPSIIRLDEDQAAWTALLDETLPLLRAGALSKVVLARTITAHCSAPLDPVRVTTSLMEKYPACQSFMFALPDGSAFVGATPETLCRVDGNGIETDALAGSAPPDSGALLLTSEKDLHEHRLVVDFIRERLAPITRGLDVPSSPRLLALPNITHLHTPIRGTLEASLSDVVTALHPTPAVCGTPQQDARAFILAHEHLRRGWYAGPVGLVGAERSHLCVALRCARISGPRAELFVGAGIVAASSTNAEWNETRRKAQPLLQALTGGAHG